MVSSFMFAVETHIKDCTSLRFLRKPRSMWIRNSPEVLMIENCYMYDMFTLTQRMAVHLSHRRFTTRRFKSPTQINTPPAILKPCWGALKHSLVAIRKIKTPAPKTIQNARQSSAAIVIRYNHTSEPKIEPPNAP